MPLRASLPFPDKLNTVADELDVHFKLFNEAKSKYSKKARNIKMVRAARGAGQSMPLP